MSALRFRVALLATACAFTLPAQALALDAVASIKPVQSLLAGVMGETGKAGLIVDGAGSPHGYALKPSQARALQNAQLVVWVGHELEVFLEEPLEHLSGKARVLTLSDVDGITKLEQREGGAFEAHSHGEGEEHGDEHGKEHDQAKEHDHAKEHAAGHGHEHGEEVNAHFWLDPNNAIVWTGAIAKALAELDPANAATYQANAERQVAALKALEGELKAALAPVAGKPFIVFHDAYPYFEERFGLTAAGSITVSPEKAPGAQRLAEIRAKIQETGAVCVFAEPQFEPRVISVVTEGTQVRTGTLDPLGADLAAGADLYAALLRKMAASFTACLGG